MNKKNLILIIISLSIILVGIFLWFKHKTGTKETSGQEKKESLQELWDLAISLESKNELLKAVEKYQVLINTYPNFNKIQEVIKGLENLNIKIITSGIATQDSAVYEVKPNDSLSKIAKQFNTTLELIKKSNSLSSDIIKVGTRLRLWTGKFSCIVDKSQNILVLKSNDKVIKTYIVSTGINNSTPIGVFRIVNKLSDPVWYKTGAIVPAASPENILGSRWLGFNLAGYGIHGTNDPLNIGQQITQGCIRLTNSDVEEIFLLLPIDTEVTVVD